MKVMGEEVVVVDDILIWINVVLVCSSTVHRGVGITYVEWCVSVCE